VAQGRIDWSDFAGRIVYAVRQEGKHAYLHDQSRKTTAGTSPRPAAGSGSPAPRQVSPHGAVCEWRRRRSRPAAGLGYSKSCEECAARVRSGFF
jgi:hypothetical protein